MSRTRLPTTLFAIGRLAFGAALLAAPERVASGWIGEDAAREPVKIVTRGLGARDIALSAGVLAFMHDEDTLASLLAFTVLCDLGDVAATLAAPADALPANARLGTVAMAGAAAATGAALAVAVKR
jgi:hypothetical protein